MNNFSALINAKSAEKLPILVLYVQQVIFKTYQKLPVGTNVFTNDRIA